MAFGELSISKTVAENAPKYRRIVEPFGDGGTFALYLNKKKPKTHLLNIEDEILFNLFLFIQAFSSSDKKALKSFDWVSSEETFENVLKIKADSGPELYYRFFYLKKFGVRSKDPEVDPTYDFLTIGQDHSNIVFTIPVEKIGLKGVEIINDDPLKVMNSASRSDTFVILAPKKSEQAEAIEAKLPLSVPFFYAKKSLDNEQIFEAAEKAKDPVIVSHFAQASIMVATMEVRTNYPVKIPPVLPEEIGGNKP